MKRLVEAFVSGHIKHLMRRIIATVGLGYGFISLYKSFLWRDMSGVVIVPNHLLRCHHFAPESSFDVIRDEDDTEMYYDITGETSQTVKRLLRGMQRTKVRKR